MVLTLAIVLLTSCATGSMVSFASDVKPILDQNCTVCHGGGNASAGINLSSYKGIMDASVVIPSDSAKSKIARVIKSGDMPQGGLRLSDDQLTIIENWIDEGALDN